MVKVNNVYFFTGGCKTYRKTLAEKSKHIVTPVVKNKQKCDVVKNVYVVMI